MKILKFTALNGDKFEMTQDQFKRLFDAGLGSDEERSHLMVQAVNQQ